LKFLIGFIAGTLANRFHLREKEEHKEIISITAISAAAALGFNVIADPIVGYFYRKYLLGIPQEAAKIIATWVAGSTAINAVVCTIISVILYLALYKSFLPRLPKE
ncbi:MAG: ECF transporter S component, partial [Erysipelotrichaceae bacterium]|nr:ECF transporter S component [Erysipelotrichaceae bacterium]